MSSSPSGSNYPGLATDFPDDNLNKLTSFLHKLAGYTDEEVSAILKEHCYARPWNWRPENLHKRSVIDVENCDEPDQLSIPSDLTNPRNSIEEALRLINFTRPEDSNDDWEEKIEKTLWSPVQRRIFSRIFMIINSERLHRLTKVNNKMELVYRRTSTDSSAKKFREVMATISWDYRILQWLHGLLVDNLSREALIIYLDILQTLRAKVPQLVDRMTAPTANAIVKPGSIPLETLNALIKRTWDPVATCLNNIRPKKLPGNPILVVVPSGVGSSISPRQHKWITQLGLLGTLVTVHSHLGLSANKMTMMTCLEQLVQATRAKIQDVRSDFPGNPVILVGFNTGAALASQVALMEHVTAVICLGFPFATAEGKRGSPEDTLMDIRCPIMFVIGQNATLVRPDDLENVREKLLVESCLVVVGTADDSLRVSSNKKISEGISQAMVDRCIMDEITDFIGGILVQPHPLPLRPAGLLNPDKNKRDARKRKNSTSSSVDSESSFPNLQKKSRSGTPGQFNTTRSQGSFDRSSGLNMQSTLVTAGNPNDVNAHNSVPRRKPKIINNQKLGSPMGPIRLPAGPSNQLNNSIQSNSSSKTSVSFSKVPKMIPSNNTPNFTGKLKTITPTNKTFNKSISANNYKSIEKSGETKLVTVLTSNGNQVRVAAPSDGQNKSSGTGGSLTALLQNRKNNDNLTEEKIANQTIPISHCESSSTTTSTASTMTKATESTNSITILPWSNKIKNSLKNDDALPKITPINNKNQWQKSHQLTPPLIKNNPSLEVDDDDLGNILDIPIIFAKDDDNLNAIEKAPPISLPITTINDSIQQKPVNKINPTKVVLLSNKEGKVYQRPTSKITPTKKIDQDLNQSDSSLVNRVVFQRRMQNSSLSSTQSSSSGSNQQPVKYTKIILSKRQNSGTSTKYTDQVVLTKNKRPSSQLIVGDQSHSSFTTTPIRVIPKLADKSNNDNDNHNIVDSEKNIVQTKTKDCKLFDESDI
ncbi:Similar to KANSL3: KAT8 regulatory NSL complex subunit 3 (Homo sapiens) [Cotesia congregata]|uniref:Similar to KANSL3: KAT8 regulatory NSL complex subunit 3 (Homo sapiens) n=1 Tax=Cotesia congregata TaxID=51543 RepID=A0A8J2EE44_COTCN|nr:Similar to KANSL3: KAT8 regulatory NSL complex subunit 3 (Homo sapiens) [Cotesia congregata]